MAPGEFQCQTTLNQNKCARRAAKDDRALNLVSRITCPCFFGALRVCGRERPAVWQRSMTKTRKQMSALMHTDGTTARWRIDLLVALKLAGFVHLFSLDSVRTRSTSPSTVRWSFPLCCQQGPETKEPMRKSLHSLNDRKSVLIMLLLKKHSKPVKTHVCWL